MVFPVVLKYVLFSIKSFTFKLKNMIRRSVIVNGRAVGFESKDLVFNSDPPLTDCGIDAS